MGNFEQQVTTELAYQFGGAYIQIKFLQNFSEEYAAANGLDIGHRCGYVTVATDKEYSNCYLDDFDYDVHGNITYNSYDNGLLTLGFDCGHWEDSLEHWTLENVRKETESLAKQMLGRY